MIRSQLSHPDFFFNDTATTEIYTLSLHDALPIWNPGPGRSTPQQASLINRQKKSRGHSTQRKPGLDSRSEEHTSELQSPCNLVCRLLLEKKKYHHVLLIADCICR